MNSEHAPSIALLYPGDRSMRGRSDPAESRFGALFVAFADHGVQVQAAVYHDDFAAEVEAQLSTQDGVLVWCNPIESGRRRDRLDALLRAVAGRGVYVSTHPDAVLRLGTKDVLFETRHLPFGSDVHRIDTLEQLDRDLPPRLRQGPRVLKQLRGQSGVGIWRVEQAGEDAAAPQVRLHHAARGSEEECVDWSTLRQSMAPYFEPANGGHMIDQAWQPRLAEGMVRAYLVEDRVTGFGRQAVNALYPSAPGAPPVPAGPRVYFAAAEPQFRSLKQRLESGWIEALCRCLGLQRDELPMLWDCDFLFGDTAPGRPERFVLCEINVSSVSPFPPSSTLPLVLAVKNKLLERRARAGR